MSMLSSSSGGMRKRVPFPRTLRFPPRSSHSFSIGAITINPDVVLLGTTTSSTTTTTTTSTPPCRSTCCVGLALVVVNGTCTSDLSPGSTITVRSAAGTTSPTSSLEDCAANFTQFASQCDNLEHGRFPTSQLNEFWRHARGGLCACSICENMKFSSNDTNNTTNQTSAAATILSVSALTSAFSGLRLWENETSPASFFAETSTSLHVLSQSAVVQSDLSLGLEGAAWSAAEVVSGAAFLGGGPSYLLNGLVLPATANSSLSSAWEGALSSYSASELYVLPRTTSGASHVFRRTYTERELGQNRAPWSNFFPNLTDRVGAGWLMVRWIPPSAQWHPAKDNLAGTEVYGDSCNLNSPFAVKFGNSSSIVIPFTEFLFASGDGAGWLIASREEVLGGGQEQAVVTKSSRYSAPHFVEWWAEGLSDHPHVSLRDKNSRRNTCGEA